MIDTYKLRKYGIEYDGTRRSGNVKLKCPNCQHERSKHKRDKPLSLNLDNGIWNCHHCGWAGSVNEYMEHKKQYRKVEINSSTPDERMISHFAQRHITKDIVDAKDIAAYRHPALGNCIAFKYYKDGALVNVKYRNGRKQFAQEKDAMPILYRYDHIQDNVVICEGEFDALSYVEAGITWATSVPMGGIRTNENVGKKMEFLDNSIDKIESCDKVYISTDNDDAGLGLRNELIRRIGAEKCYIVRLPEGCKDANEALIKHGPAALQDAIDNAEAAPLKGISTVKDNYMAMQQVYDEGLPEGRSWGWPEMDKETCKLHNGMIVITGIPSHGKSNFFGHVAIHQMVNYGRKYAYFTPEEMPPTVHLTQLAEKLVGRPLLPRYNNRMEFTDLQKAMDFLHEHIYYILPDEERTSNDYLREQVRILVRKYGITDVVIDPWTEIEHDYGNKNGTDYTNNELSAWRNLQRNLDLCLFIIAHPTKQNKYWDKEIGRFVEPKPTLYDISGSANWKNKADIGVVVHRDFENNTSSIHIAKLRHRWYGKIGFMAFNFDVSCGRYYPVGTQSDNKSYMGTKGNEESVNFEQQERDEEFFQAPF